MAYIHNPGHLLLAKRFYKVAAVRTVDIHGEIDDRNEVRLNTSFSNWYNLYIYRKYQRSEYEKIIRGVVKPSNLELS